jgi:hypothetical protein
MYICRYIQYMYVCRLCTHKCALLLNSRYEADQDESVEGIGGQPTLTLPSISEDDEVDEEDDGQRLLTAR